jgi:hypothetical protein
MPETSLFQVIFIGRSCWSSHKNAGDEKRIASDQTMA